jgi:hypothetical protein
VSGDGAIVMTESSLAAGGAPDGRKPGFHAHVWPWLKGPAQRFIMPNWAAITIGSHIFSWQPLDDFLLAHELCHVRQWGHHGLMYIPRYFSASRVAKAAGKDQYRGNAFEEEAYGIEAALRASRTGPQHA